MQISEFQANLVFRASSSTARATYTNPAWKQRNKQKKLPLILRFIMASFPCYLIILSHTPPYSFLIHLRASAWVYVVCHMHVEVCKGEESTASTLKQRCRQPTPALLQQHQSADSTLLPQIVMLYFIISMSREESFLPFPFIFLYIKHKMVVLVFSSALEFVGTNILCNRFFC